MAPPVSQARYIVGDVFDVMATMPDGSVDLMLTSPPFLALRSYLPGDHPDKARRSGRSRPRRRSSTRCCADGGVAPAAGPARVDLCGARRHLQRSERRRLATATSTAAGIGVYQAGRRNVADASHRRAPYAARAARLAAGEVAVWHPAPVPPVPRLRPQPAHGRAVAGRVAGGCGTWWRGAAPTRRWVRWGTSSGRPRRYMTVACVSATGGTSTSTPYARADVGTTTEPRTPREP